MGRSIEEIKKSIKGETVSADVVLDLLQVIEDMEKEIASLTERCSDLEEEVEAINEDINLIYDGMHIEEYDTMFSAVCPYCHEEIEINVEELEEEEDFTCPHCKKEISLEWDDECDCGCSDCGHDCDDECDCGDHE